MKKLMNKKGFTLMEMLIVVAIIVILVAIAIPTFSSSLDDAKKATDDANLRAAKAVAINNEMLDGWNSINTVSATVYFDVDNSKFESATTNADKGQYSGHKEQYIIVEFDENGKMKADSPKWADAPTKPAS